MTFVIKGKGHEAMKREVGRLLKENDPEEIMAEITKRKRIGKIIVYHKKGDADIKEPNIVYVDFGPKPHGAFDIWATICHEVVHLMLRRDPPWYANEQTQKILKHHKKYVPVNFHYSFQYLIEQSLAFMIQVTCIYEVGQCRLEYKVWKTMFENSGVSLFTKTAWKDWLRYLKSKDDYDSIDDWIAETLEKHWRISK